MKDLLVSFLAFNQNAFAYATHAVLNNFWYIGIICGLVGCIVLHLREEAVLTVKEEQQVL